MHSDGDGAACLPGSRKLPLFSFYIDKDFPTFCAALSKRGAVFDMACSHPGGYYARILDPAGNSFEIWCDSAEDEAGTDPFSMPFFYNID